MRMPTEFDKANKERRKDNERDTCRHFVLWAKLQYKGKSLEDIICKITGSTNYNVDYKSKAYWLIKTCKMYNIDGYSIIELFIDKSYGFCVYDNEIEQMLSAMRAELQGLKVNNGEKVIWDLGKADLFEEG